MNSAVFLPRPPDRLTSTPADEQLYFSPNVVDEYGDEMNDIDEYSLLRPDVDDRPPVVHRANSTGAPPHGKTRHTFSMSAKRRNSNVQSKGIGKSGNSFFGRMFRSRAKVKNETTQIETPETTPTPLAPRPARQSSCSRLFRTRSSPSRRQSQALTRKTRARRFKFVSNRKYIVANFDEPNSRVPTSIDRETEEKSAPIGLSGFGSMVSEISEETSNNDGSHQHVEESVEPAILEHLPLALHRTVDVEPKPDAKLVGSQQSIGFSESDGKPTGSQQSMGFSEPEAKPTGSLQSLGFSKPDAKPPSSLQSLGFSMTMQTLDIAPLCIVDTVNTIDIEPKPSRSKSMTIERKVLRSDEINGIMHSSRSERSLVVAKATRLEGEKVQRKVSFYDNIDGREKASYSRRSVLAKASLFEKVSGQKKVLRFKKADLHEKFSRRETADEQTRPSQSGKMVVQPKALRHERAKLVHPKKLDRPSLALGHRQVDNGMKPSRSMKSSVRALVSRFEQVDEGPSAPSKSGKVDVRAMASRFEQLDQQASPSRSNSLNGLAKRPSLTEQHVRGAMPLRARTWNSVSNPAPVEERNEDVAQEAAEPARVEKCVKEHGKAAVEEEQVAPARSRSLSVLEALARFEKRDPRFERSKLKTVKEKQATLPPRSAKTAKVALPSPSETKERKTGSSPVETMKEQANLSPLETKEREAKSLLSRTSKSETKPFVLKPAKDKAEPSPPKTSVVLSELVLVDKSVSSCTIEGSNGSPKSSFTAKSKHDDGQDQKFANIETMTSPSGSGSIEPMEVDLVINDSFGKLPDVCLQERNEIFRPFEAVTDDSFATPNLSRACSPVRKQLFKPIEAADPSELVKLALATAAMPALNVNPVPRTYSRGGNGPPSVDVARIISEYVSTPVTPAKPSRNELPVPKINKA